MIRLLLLFLFSISAAAQVSNITKVAWEQVPPTVQNAIHAQAGSLGVQNIERGLSNGQIVYSAEVQRPEGNTRIVVADTAPLPLATSNSAAAASSTPVSSATNAAQVITDSAGAETVYHVNQQSDGQSSQISVTEKGQVISATQVSPVTVGFQKVAWNALPSVVQNTVLAQAGPGEIIDLIRGTLNGQPVYEVVLVQNAQHTRLRISDTGAVLGQAVISAADQRVTAVEPYIGFDQIPVAVQTTMRSAAGGQAIESVRQQVVDGQIIYVGVYRQNGAPVTIRISQTGQLLR